MAKHIEQRLREQLAAKGHPANSAARIARAQMVKSGNVTKSGELTPKGKARSEMGAAGRAKDRAARGSGHDPDEFSYNPRTNTARLKR